MTLVGYPQTFGHDAAAIRFFGDVAATSDTLVSRHIHDMELVCLCAIEPDGRINPEESDEMQSSSSMLAPRIVLTGKSWLAAQPKPESTK